MPAIITGGGNAGSGNWIPSNDAGGKAKAGVLFEGKMRVVKVLLKREIMSPKHKIIPEII